MQNAFEAGTVARTIQKGVQKGVFGAKVVTVIKRMH